MIRRVCTQKKITHHRESIRFLTMCLVSYAEHKGMSVTNAAKLFTQNDINGFLLRNEQTEGGLSMHNIIEDIDKIISRHGTAAL